MKLVSARIRNYRVHRDCVVDFSGHPTLIAGPNESGKSTLIEAIHCGLFLRAGTGGQIRKAMESDHGGQPEVEVTFETGSGRFVVRKRFSGASGTTTLEESGRPALSGGEAEERLSQVLGVDAIAGGGAEGKLDKRWAHLWVKQGRSGADPCGEFQDHHNDLVSRLQSMNGAAAMQSDFDRRVHERLRGQLAEFLTDTGKVRADTPLHSLQKQIALVREKEADALTAVERLESAICQLESAEEILLEKAPQLAAAEDRLRSLRVTQTRVRELGESLRPLAIQLDGIVSETAAVAKHSGQIAAISDSIPQLRQACEAALNDLSEATEAAKIPAHPSFHDEVESGRKALDHARGFREGCRLLVDCVRLKQDLSQIEKQSKVLGEREAELTLKQNELARLPRITSKTLEKLRAHQQRRIEAVAALNALATRVDVLAADEEVLIAGEPAAPGSSRSHPGAFSIEAGEGVRLRITPGGGASLDEGRKAVEKAESALGELLAQVEARSLSDAQSHLDRRTALEADVRSIQRGIEQAGGGELHERHRRTQQEFVEVEAKWIRARRDLPNLPEATTEEAAQAALAEAEKNCSSLEVALARATELRTQAAEKLALANRQIKDAQMVSDQAKRVLADAEVRLRTLEETHGNEMSRKARREELEKEREEVVSRKQAIETQLRELGADQIETQLEMTAHAVDQLRAQLQQAQISKAAATARLDEAGTGDGDLQDLREQLAALEARQNVEQLRVSSLQLLIRLFEEQMAALEKRFTQPLLEKVSDYLSIVFGPESRASARYQEGEFQELTIDRSAQGLGTHAFAALSGGAREQLALAFRLAIAEIVAQAHDGCLPVVLDDAFVNSDPERVKALLLMVYRASQNGLQILLCTCNPADYAELGAKEIRLPRPTHRSVPVFTAPETPTSCGS